VHTNKTLLANTHGGDHAMALAYIPFQSINKGHASLAIRCKGIQIDQIVLHLQLRSFQNYMINNNGFFFIFDPFKTAFIKWIFNGDI
jgi:hypothetical protein